MNQQAITEHLAINVMGWKPMYYPFVGNVWAEDTEIGECYVMPREKFDPFNDAEQALDVFIAADFLSVNMLDRVFKSTREIKHAICIAAARASGYEGDV